MVWIRARFSTYGSECCTFSVGEWAGSLQMCAEIMFINGTAVTTTNYTVTMHANGLSGSARSKFPVTVTVNSLRECTYSKVLLGNLYLCTNIHG